MIKNGGTTVGRNCRNFLLNLARAGLLVACVVGAPATFGESSSITAQAPFQIVATGFQKPSGLVLHSTGDVFFSDRETGVLYRLTPGYSPSGESAFTGSVVFAGLERPIDVAVEHDGGLLVAESGMGRLVRFAKLNGVFSAVPEPIVENLKDPRWLALDGAGNVLVSTSGMWRKEGKQAALDPKGDALLRVAPDHTLTVVADRFVTLRGLALTEEASTLYVAATRQRGDNQEHWDKDQSPGTIFRIGLPTGTVTPVVDGQIKEPEGLALDALGALFITAKRVRPPGEPEDSEAADESDEEDPDPAAKGVILKAAFKDDGTLDQLKVFSAGLGKPEGLAFDRDGNLYVAEAKHGRVLRFQAPAPPLLDPPLPPFTRQGTLTVGGTAEPNARITILGGAQPATGLTDGTTGAFAIEVALIPDSGQTLKVFATGSGGDGLTSRATEATVTQDDIPPDTVLSGCPSGSLTSPTVTFGFSGTDNLTQTEQLVFASRLDGAPFSPFSSSTSVTFTSLTPGDHTLLVKAQDQAGNEDPTPAVCTFTVASPLPIITGVNPGSVAQGITTHLVITGLNLANATAVTFTTDGITATILPGATSQALTVGLAVASSVPVGTYTFSVTTPAGTAQSGAITVAVKPPVPSFATTSVSVMMPLDTTVP